MSEVEDLQTEEEHQRFPREAKRILKDAKELKELKGQLPEFQYTAKVQDINVRLDPLLAEPITEPKNLRLANRMRKHRAHLLTFLDYDLVEATNNRSERQLRQLVLQRKISAGNRSERGARIHSVLTSVFATAFQGGVNFMKTTVQALRYPSEGALPPVRSPC